MARKQFIDNYHIVFGIAVVFGLILIVLAMDRGSCPEQEYITKYIEKDCPVQECTDVVCPECVCPACEERESIIRYVCPDGSTAAEADMCELELDTAYDPVDTNEEGTLIESVSVNSACLYGTNGGAVKYKVGSIASVINFQVKKSVNDEFKTVYTEENKYEGYTEFSLVDGTETYTRGDFDLDIGEVYLFRMEFFFPGYDQFTFSNEYIIDTREDEKYMKVECS